LNATVNELNPTLSGAERYAETRRVTVIGMIGNAFLVVIKLVCGFIGHSQALIADGLHSLSDLSNDFLLLFAAKHAARDADEEHPYGHGRIETLFSMAQGLMLGAFAIGIGFDAVQRLLDPAKLLQPALFTLAVAVISVITKEWMYRYTIKAARRLRSNMLRGNAWDHRSDAISSVIVVIGVGGTFAGFHYLDAIAAIGVALMIIKISWDLIWHSLRELIDTGLEAERVEAIRQAIMSVDGVQQNHMLRTRRMGGQALVDVHILVDPTLSVSEGHQISEIVRARVINLIDEVSDVMVHIDPEDDEDTPAPSTRLPLRSVMRERLQQCWQPIPAAARIEDLTLHYLDGKVSVEVLLPLDAAGGVEQARNLAAEFKRATEGLEDIGSIDVRFH
jgi:cation diffusion facilitator family transporter